MEKKYCISAVVLYLFLLTPIFGQIGLPMISDYLEQKKYISFNFIPNQYFSSPLIIKDHIILKDKIWDISKDKEYNLTVMKNLNIKERFYMYTSKNTFIYDILINDTIAVFNPPYSTNQSVNKLFNESSIVIPERKSVFLYNLLTKTKIWEKSFSRVDFSTDCGDEYLVIEDVSGKRLKKCYLYNKNTGDLNWSVDLGWQTYFFKYNMDSLNKFFFIENDVRLKKDGFGIESIGSVIKFIDLKDGSIHILGDGDNFFISNNEIFVTGDFGTKVYSLSNLNLVRTFLSKGKIICQFDNKFLYQYNEDFLLYNKEPGELLAKGVEDMDFYKKLNVVEEEGDGDGFTPLELFFTNEFNGQLLALVNRGGIVIFNIVK